MDGKVASHCESSVDVRRKDVPSSEIDRIVCEAFNRRIPDNYAGISFARVAIPSPPSDVAFRT